MIDVGLSLGVRSMWHKNQLRDYTIKVEDQEFRVHKLVLVAVSEYFEAMLCDSFEESTKDWVELKGLSADIVAKLLEFIYTGEEDGIKGHALEILKCAIYLQMHCVSEFCVKKLLEDLSYKNCLKVLFVFREYSLQHAAEKAKDFIKTNYSSVIEHWKPENVTYAQVWLIVDFWEKSERELFLFINKWVTLDYKNRKGHVNQLLCQVRFCLISSIELKAIKKMDIFSETSSSWCDLVEKAEEYHQLPINLKVLEPSEQSKLRTEPTPVFLSSKTTTFWKLDKDNKWQKHDNEALGTPTFPDKNRAFGIVVNNFFVVCTRNDENREWYVFDPRTLTWSQIASMPQPRTGFVLLHHGDHLYTVGGEYKTKTNSYGLVQYTFEPCYGMEQYSFRSNTWSWVSVPFSVVRHAACVCGDSIYISGGVILEEGAEGDYEPSDALYCLNLSAPDQEWEKKAPGVQDWIHHKLYVAHIENEDVPIVIAQKFLIMYYSPSKEEWLTPIGSSLRWEQKMFESIRVIGVFLSREESPFLLEVDIKEYGSAGEFDIVEHHLREPICLRWKNPKKGIELLNFPTKNFPLSPGPQGEWDYNIFSAILAVP